MIRENLLYKIMCGIHIVFFTSILCATVIVCSGTILFLPAIAALFPIGKDVLYKRINISDSIIKMYVRALKSKLRLVRYLPINLLFLLNYLGFSYAARMNLTILAIACIVLMALLLTLTLYIAGYDEFMEEKGDTVTALMAMFSQPQYLVPVYSITILFILFFNGYLALLIALCGSFFLIALEALVFLQFLRFKLLFHIEDEDTQQFAYLVKQKVHKI